MTRWFRFYDDVINDPKVLKLPENIRWSWVAVLCIASKGAGNLPSLEDTAFLLRTTKNKAEAILSALVSAGLLDKTEAGYSPHNWGGRQFLSDSSAERVKRHREKREAAGLQSQWTAPKSLRKDVYARDNHECVYCQSPDDLTLDHMIPESRGGTHDIENLQTCCRKCNASKRDLTHQEYVTRNGHVTLLKRPQNTEAEQNRTEQSRAESKIDAPPTAAPRAVKRALPLPIGWEPSARAFELAEQHGQNVQVVESIFRDYLASSGKLYRDYDAAFHNFIRNQQSFNRGGSNGVRQSDKRGSIIDAADRAIAKLEREIAAEKQGCSATILSLPSQRLR